MGAGKVFEIPWCSRHRASFGAMGCSPPPVLERPCSSPAGDAAWMNTSGLRPAEHTVCLNRSVAGEPHCLPKELRRLPLLPACPFLHISTCFCPISIFYPLGRCEIDVIVFSREFPRFLLRLISHLCFLCVKCPFFYDTDPFLTIGVPGYFGY